MSWGYCSAISYTGPGTRNYDLTKITKDLGEAFTGLDRIAIKYYPIGGDQHSIVDNILALKAEHGITPDMVDRVTIGSTRFSYKNKLRTPAENLTSANFSACYCAAMALTHDMPPVFESDVLLRLWPQAFTRPDIIDLERRVQEVVDDAIERNNPYSMDSVVTIRLKDGREVTRRTDWSNNSPTHGTIRLKTLDDARIEGKFRNQALMVLPRSEVDELLQRVRDLEQLSDVRQLAAFTGPSQ